MDVISIVVVRDRGVRKVKMSLDDPSRQSMVDMTILCKHAIADFPGLLLANINVSLAGDTFSPDMIGIEFEIAHDQILPDGYFEVSLSR